MRSLWILLLCFLVILLLWSAFFGRPLESMGRTTVVEPEVPIGRTEFITFGDGLYKEQSRNFARVLSELPYCSKVHSFSGEDIDEDFRLAHDDILKQPRGFGYWLWKPYFCKRVWDTLSVGDVLVYLDGGLVMTGDLSPYIQRAVRSKSGGLAFEQWIHQRDFCKPETFIAMDMSVARYGRLLQFWAAIIIVQKRETNLSFFDEWLSYCTIPGLIDDTPSKIKTTYKYKHRHDQSIYSLMAWRYEFDIDVAGAYLESVGRPVSRSRPKGYTPTKDP